MTRALVWLRRDLRLYDHAALSTASSRARQGGKVSIVIEVHGSRLMIRIVDTGVGARSNEGGRTDGIGLRNTDLRLRTLYGESSALQTKTAEGGGFEVTFSIPINPEVH